ncbi:unnamed protein product [Protopolystoma xenopodis]|uniref:Uncharacterized protein n=1 Tax=Protopolystoma xenopodis TaxID=117903 RepID=A0A3S5A1B2_9PLAT|nr:unnamed protein product [Protopolystoma xenopodis]
MASTVSRSSMAYCVPTSEYDDSACLRIKENQKLCRNMNTERSEIAEHIAQTGHEIEWKSTEGLAAYGGNTRKRDYLLREATSRGLSTAAEEISRCQARRAWPPTPAPSVTVCPATVSATYAAASVHNSCLPLSWIIRDAPRANCLVDRLVRRCLFEASVWRTGFWQMDRVYSPDNLADVAEDEMSKVDDQQKHQEPEADPNWKLLEDEIIELATILHAALAASLSSQSSSFSVLNVIQQSVRFTM